MANDKKGPRYSKTIRKKSFSAYRKTSEPARCKKQFKLRKNSRPAWPCWKSVPPPKTPSLSKSRRRPSKNLGWRSYSSLWKSTPFPDSCHQKYSTCLLRKILMYIQQKSGLPLYRRPKSNHRTQKVPLSSQKNHRKNAKNAPRQKDLKAGKNVNRSAQEKEPAAWAMKKQLRSAAKTPVAAKMMSDKNGIISS